MQAAHNSPAQGHGSPRKQKQAGFISRLCGRSSQYEDAHVPGKKWVQVFDHAGAKWGHVLLSSWLDTSEERTVMHHSSPPPPMMQPLMAPPQQSYLPPPPSYLPPLQNARDLGGGVVSQGKGYQQLTSWQVMAHPSPGHDSLITVQHAPLYQFVWANLMQLSIRMHMLTVLQVSTSFGSFAPKQAMHAAD